MPIIRRKTPLAVALGKPGKRAANFRAARAPASGWFDMIAVTISDAVHQTIGPTRSRSIHATQSSDEPGTVAAFVSMRCTSLPICLLLSIGYSSVDSEPTLWEHTSPRIADVALYSRAYPISGACGYLRFRGRRFRPGNGEHGERNGRDHRPRPVRCGRPTVGTYAPRRIPRAVPFEQVVVDCGFTVDQIRGHKGDSIQACRKSVSSRMYRPRSAIDQRAALCIPKARHRYAETGEGRVKPLKVEAWGLPVSASATTASRFDEATDTITVHPSPTAKTRTAGVLAEGGAAAVVSHRPRKEFSIEGNGT